MLVSYTFWTFFAVFLTWVYKRLLIWIRNNVQKIRMVPCDISIKQSLQKYRNAFPIYLQFLFYQKYVFSLDIWRWSPCAFWPRQSSHTRLSRHAADQSIIRELKKVRLIDSVSWSIYIRELRKQHAKFDWLIQSVLRIQDILVWIRILILLFSSLTLKTPAKNKFFSTVFPLIAFWRYIYIIFQWLKVKKRSHKAVGIRFFLQFFLLDDRRIRIRTSY